MSGADAFKRDAALAAVAHVRSGARVGLGTGSTAKHAIVEIGRRLRAGELQGVVGVATSEASAALARECGVPLEELDGRALDVAIDGADEIAPNLDVTKGHGNALVREKLVAWHAREFIVVADDSKLVSSLGEHMTLSVEIVPFGARATLADLERLGCAAVLRERDGSVVRSDNGNFVADCAFGAVADAAALEARLVALPGVVGTGFFLGLARVAYVAGAGGVRRLERGA